MVLDNGPVDRHLRTSQTVRFMPGDQPTLLVPGTQATALRDQEGRRVYNAVRVQLVMGREDLGERDPDQVGKLLSMEHVPGQLKPARTSLENGTHVVRGDVLRTPYDGLPVTDWFRYDWRADLRFNAYKLPARRDAAGCALESHWTLPRRAHHCSRQ